MTARRKRATPAPRGKKAAPAKRAAEEVIDLDDDDDVEQPAGADLVVCIKRKLKERDTDPLLTADGGLQWAEEAVAHARVGDLYAELLDMADGIATLNAPICTPLAALRTSCGQSAAMASPPAKRRKAARAGHQDKTAAAASAEQKRDTQAVAALKEIVAHMRDLPCNASGEVLVPVYPDYAAFVAGGLFECLRSLFRNDSLLDISTRSSLYHFACEAVEFASRSTSLARLLLHRPASAGPGEAATPSIVDLLKTMKTQADVYISQALQLDSGATAADGGVDIHDTSEGLVASDAAMSLRDAVGNILKNLTDKNLQVDPPPATPTRGKGKAPKRGSAEQKAAAESAAERAYIDAMTGSKFAVTTMTANADGTGDYTHVYARDIAGSGQVSHQAVVKIMKEMSTLATTLPVHYHSSIFVRVDEKRNDVMKALIIGPANTPYENACFTFDILLPKMYPAEPPKVTATTTWGGRVRMNPNLYASGKVCLSLLGTWSGPGWDPKTSTVLQVLLSIQGLILVPDPFFNEPGFDPPNPRSDRFNDYIKIFSCKAGIVEMLAHPDPVFKDVIQRHFRLKKAEIKQQAIRWLRQNAAEEKPPGEFGFGFGPYGFNIQPYTNPKHNTHLSPKGVLADTLAALDRL